MEGLMHRVREILQGWVEQNGVPPSVEALPWDAVERVILEEWTNSVHGVVGHAGKEALKDVGIPADSFHVQNPDTLEWLRTHGAELVTDVTEKTKAGIREAVRTAIENEEAPREQAKVIRQLVGLREDQVQQIQRFHDQLVEDGVEGDALDRAMEKRGNRAMQQRAMNIARTETMAASNAGMHQAWDGARRAGYLDASLMEREWIAGTGSARTCEDCEAMDGQRAPIDEPFTTPDGDSIMMPPLHPSCRCVCGLVFKDDETE